MNTRMYYTVSEVMKLCGVSRTTVYNWLKSGKLTSARSFGNRHLISSASIPAYMRTEPSGEIEVSGIHGNNTGGTEVL